MGLDIVLVNQRVDEALKENGRALVVVIAMFFFIFLIGILILILAYWLKNPYVATGTLLFQTLLYRPINEIKKLRRDNIILKIFASLLPALSVPDQAKEINRLLERLNT